jgi:hypothetical protein
VPTKDHFIARESAARTSVTPRVVV